ncbi:MAG: laccase, partial [Saccharothrix sp.]|nr:laccase [Saccharothrix sp.]
MTVTQLAQGVRVAITDRSGGTGTAPFDTRNLGGAVGDDPETVRDNRRRTATELGLDPDRVVFMRQVHGTGVAYVTKPHHDTSPPLDAVFTDRPGLALAVLVADCAPVLVADAAAGVVGAAHSGRVGTAAGVVPALI